MISMLASVLLFPTAASAQTAVTEKVEAEMAEAESVRMARAGREMFETRHPPDADERLSRYRR